MKKILFLHAGAELYGADIVLLELLKGLDKRKYTPYVILPCDGPLVEELEKNRIFTEIINYPILRRKYFNIKGIVQFIIHYFKYSTRLVKRAHDLKIDLLHINTTAVMEGVFLKLRLKCPLVWHVHEIILTPHFMYQLTSFILNRYADRIIAVSEAVRCHLINSGVISKEIQVIYNGVDNRKFRQCEYDSLHDELAIPKQALIIGMVGRVNAWKGQQDFVKVMQIVIQKNCNVYAVIAGDAFAGEEWRVDKLKESIHEAGLDHYIKFCGFRNDCERLYCLFDIFVLPSINPDPLPTVVLEAMACGCPVVGYAHGGICEMVEDRQTGLLASKQDVNDMAQKVLFLVNHPEQRIAMGMEGQKRQKQFFSLEAYINHFQKIYEDIV